MVGEIRDNETAEIAARAAVTGHLVLSTLHTNSAAASITRLADMDVAPYLIASSLVAVFAQTLVKKLCNHCKLPYLANEGDRTLLGEEEPITLFKPIGCSRCNYNGYAGRKAVYEILKLDNNTRKMILDKRSIEDIRMYHMMNGMNTLAESCKESLYAGETSIEEYLKLTYTLDV